MTALADALIEWIGAILVVSHDRYLIRRVVEGEKEDVDCEEEENELRRRTVFLLKGGVLKVLEKGVSKFEESLQRRVEKLLVF